MIRFHDLRGLQRRRHLRLLRRIRDREVIYVRGEHVFRMVERLHRAGVVTAAASKANWLERRPRRPFRELAVYASEAEARREYPWTVLPRSGR